MKPAIPKPMKPGLFPLTLMSFKATAELAVALGFCDKPEQRKISFYKKTLNYEVRGKNQATSFRPLPQNSVSSLLSTESVFGFIL